MAETQIETDVLIVGGGPVGLVAAYELRRRGVDCVQVDNQDDIPRWSKANALNPRTLMMLRQVMCVSFSLESVEMISKT